MATWPKLLLTNSRWRVVLVLMTYFALAVIVMRGPLFEAGTIGLRNDWSIAPFSIQYQARMDQALVNWSQDYLGLPLIRRTDLLLTTVLWFFASIFNFGGPVFSRVIPLLAFTWAGFFSYLLLLHMDKQQRGAFVGGLLYMLSPLIFNLMVFGQHHFLIGYALYPLLVLMFLKTLAAKTPLAWIIATGTIFAFTISQDTFLVIGGLTLLAIVVGTSLLRRPTNWLRPLVRNALLAAGVVITGLLLHAPTWMSLLAHSVATNETLQLLTVAWNTWRAPEALDALSLEGAGIRSFLDAVTVNRKGWWMLANSAVVLTVFSAVLLPRKRRLMLALSAMAMFTLFIFKGSHAPLGFINEWIFTHVPGMLTFRNLQYLTVFTNLIFSILLAHVINHWHGLAKAKAKTSWQQLYLRGAFLGVILVLLLKAGPLLTGDFNSGVQTYQLSQEYEDIYRRLYQDPEDYRVLWLPSVQPMTYKSTAHAGLDPFGSQSPKPSLIDNPTHPIAWLINMVIYTRPDTDLSELFNKLAIRYVIYRDDLVSRTPLFQWSEFPKDEWTNDQIKRWLLGQSELVAESNNEAAAIDVYRHANSRARLTGVGVTNLSSGDLSDYVWLSDFWPTEPGGAIDTIFASQIKSDNVPALQADTVGRVTIVNNNLFDLTALWLKDSAINLYLPEVFRDTKDGWSQNWPWKDWRYAAILDPAVFTVKEYDSTIPFASETVENASLWVKTYQSTKATSLSFAIDGRILRTVITASEALQGLEWHQIPLGTLPAGQHKLTVSSSQGENVIANMMIVSGADVAKAKEAVQDYLQARELYLALNFDLRDTPTYSSVPDRDTGTDEVFANMDLLLEVPLAGRYDIALNASGGDYISQEQRESDSYQTIERGKVLAQTFAVDLNDTRIERVQISAEARELATNEPASVMPDAPLKVELFQIKDQKKIWLGESIISPSTAGTNDAWKLVDANFNAAIERVEEAFPEYVVEFSSEATEVAWTVRTVLDGFRNKRDYYERGVMLVDGRAQPGDMIFTVIARSEDAKLDAVAIDETPIPSEDFSNPWQNRISLDLAEGTHTVKLRGVRSHTADVQLMMRRQSPEASLDSPAITLASHGITEFSTNTINSSRPYMLVFAESYNSQWQAEVKLENGESYVVPKDYQLTLNGFSNGWLINETRPHTILVQYLPQRSYRAGLYISGIVALVILSLLGWQGIRFIRRRI